MPRPIKQFATTTIVEVIGCLKWHGPPKSIQEMDESIVREARRSAIMSPDDNGITR